jgi:ABC-type lipoprotein export system ATPase subunit
MICFSKVTKEKKDKDSSFLNQLSFSLPDQGFFLLQDKNPDELQLIKDLLGSFDSADSGKVFVAGNDLSLLDARGCENYRKEVFLSFSPEEMLLDSLTLEENLRLALKMRGIKKTSEEIDDVLLEEKLNGKNRFLVSQLSFAEKIRILEAEVRLVHPLFILADLSKAPADTEEKKAFLSSLSSLGEAYLVLLLSTEKPDDGEYSFSVLSIVQGQNEIPAFLAESAAEEKSSVSFPSRRNPFFPVSVADRLSFRYLRKKPVFYWLAIFFTALSFGLFGVFFSGTEERVSSSAAAAISQTDDYLSLSLQGGSSEEANLFSEESLLHLNQETGNDFSGVFGGSLSAGREAGTASLSLSHNILNLTARSESNNPYYLSSLSGYLSVKKLSSSYTYLAGSEPEKSDEIAVSDRVLTMFQTYGYQNPEEKTSLEPNQVTASSLIGKGVKIGYYQESFVITGIFNSHFRWDAFSSLKGKTYSSDQILSGAIGKEEKTLWDECACLNTCSYSSLCFVSEEYSHQFHSLVKTKTALDYSDYHENIYSYLLTGKGNPDSIQKTVRLCLSAPLKYHLENYLYSQISVFYSQVTFWRTWVIVSALVFLFLAILFLILFFQGAAEERAKDDLILFQNGATEMNRSANRCWETLIAAVFCLIPSFVFLYLGDYLGNILFSSSLGVSLSLLAPGILLPVLLVFLPGIVFSILHWVWRKK